MLSGLRSGLYTSQLGSFTSKQEDTAVIWRGKLVLFTKKRKKAKKFSIKYINYTDDDLTLLSST